MTMNTLLDGVGRIKLPDFVQADLGVKPGDELTLIEENGRWLIKASASSPARPTATADGEDLNWEDLGYDPVPLKRGGQVAVQFERRGRLQPMAHDLDEE